MQEVAWERLSPTSQHPSFFNSVQSIFDRALALDLFHENITELPDVEVCGEQYLLERAALRDAAYCVCGFGAVHRTTKHDIKYIARDNVSDSIKEAQVYQTAKLVDSWSTNLKRCSQLLRETGLWGKPLSARGTESAIRPGHDIKWLDPPTTILPRDWCTL